MQTESGEARLHYGKLRVGEMFSGPGGIGLALNRARTDKFSFEHVWATDWDSDTSRTYKHNVLKNDDDERFICADVRSLDIDALPPVDGFLYGFPCNDFSLIGEAKGINGSFGGLYSYGVLEEDVFGLGPDASVVCSRRTMIEKRQWIQQPNRGVLSRSAFARHWTKAKRDLVLEQYKDDPVRSVDKNLERIDPWMVLEQPEEPPQLLIYPLRTINQVSNERLAKLRDAKLFTSDEPFVSVVFGLPRNGSSSSDEVWVEYDVNRIGQMHKDEGYNDEWGGE